MILITVEIKGETEDGYKDQADQIISFTSDKSLDEIRNGLGRMGWTPSSQIAYVDNRDKMTDGGAI